MTSPAVETSGSPDRSNDELQTVAPAKSESCEMAVAPPKTEAGTEAAAPLPARTPLRSRWRRMLPDLAKVTLAFAVIGFGAAIWYQPPLLRADFPYVSCLFQGQPLEGVALYRPLAMPTRYYIELPLQLAGRYTWFAVDRRREVAALAEAPAHRFLGRNAIKRSDPLGLDLEFRKLDNAEWRVFFFEDSILFSNAVLTVKLGIKQDKSLTGK